MQDKIKPGLHGSAHEEHEQEVDRPHGETAKKEPIAKQFLVVQFAAGLGDGFQLGVLCESQY